jgi:hypothetical protein
MGHRELYQIGNHGFYTYVDGQGNLITNKDQDAPVNIYLSRFLDTSGDGTGTKNANGDYSPTGSGQTIFFIQPASGVNYKLARMIVSIQDNQVLSAGGYGGIVGALASGIQVRVADDNGTITDLTDGIPIDSNAAWGRYCYDVMFTDFGAGDNFVEVRWTFSKAETLLRLEGSENERLEVVLNDDLDGLTGHYFLVQGYTEETTT